MAPERNWKVPTPFLIFTVIIPELVKYYQYSILVMWGIFC